MRVERVKEEFPGLSMEGIEACFTVHEGMVRLKEEQPATGEEAREEEIPPAAASDALTNPWDVMCAGGGEPASKRFKEGSGSQGSGESSYVSNRSGFQGGEWDSDEKKSAIAESARELMEGMDEGMPDDQIPGWIGYQVQKLQKKNGWGREQWRRFISWSEGGQAGNATIRDPNKISKDRCLLFLSCMAKGNFWSEEWSEYGRGRYWKASNRQGGWSGRTRWSDNDGGRGESDPTGTSSGGGQRPGQSDQLGQQPRPPQVPQGWIQGIGGQVPGQSDQMAQLTGAGQSTHLVQLAQMMAAAHVIGGQGMPLTQQGYPIQSPFGTAPPLGLMSPPLPPPTPMPAQPRGRSATGTWGGEQGSSSGGRASSTGRSRSGRFRMYPYPKRSLLVGFEPIDWVCGSCNWINFSKNDGCQKCAEGYPPELGKSPVRGGSVFVKDAIDVGNG